MQLCLHLCMYIFPRDFYGIPIIIVWRKKVSIKQGLPGKYVQTYIRNIYFAIFTAYLHECFALAGHYCRIITA